jgi:PhnB protein
VRGSPAIRISREAKSCVLNLALCSSFNKDKTLTAKQKRNKMTTRIKAIPTGFHTLTPHLTVKGADQAIEFYKNAFGAEEIARMPGPDGKSIMHAELKIGDSRLFLCDEYPEMGSKGPQGLGGTPVTLHVYVEDADSFFNQAVAAGAQVNMPLEDMFWGDRYGQVIDPFGHRWSVASHKEDLTPEEIGTRAQAFFGACGEG